MNFERILHTNGKGLWSNYVGSINVIRLDILKSRYGNFGELCVYFNPKEWDVKSRGLIYTDRLFINEFKTALRELGIDTNDLDYSEQGMQGDDYVSFDIGPKFIG